MKILHISDLHIGNLISPPNEGERAEELVDAIIEKWEKMDDGQKPIIVITGDIVDSGFKWQYKKADKILQKLKENNFEIVTAPGNHDYGPKGNLASARRFKKYYCKYIEKVTYPHVAVEKDGFSIIALNSMQNETGDKDKYWADGELGGTQLDELDRKLDWLKMNKGNDHKIVLILHHHPFDLKHCGSKYQWWHCLKDGDDLMRRIEGKVDVLLFGHEHEETKWENEFGIPLVYMSDKSTRRKKLQACLITLKNGKPVAEKVKL